MVLFGRWVMLCFRNRSAAVTANDSPSVSRLAEMLRDSLHLGRVFISDSLIMFLFGASSGSVRVSATHVRMCVCMCRRGEGDGFSTWICF